MLDALAEAVKLQRNLLQGCQIVQAHLVGQQTAVANGVMQWPSTQGKIKELLTLPLLTSSNEKPCPLPLTYLTRVISALIKALTWYKTRPHHWVIITVRSK